MSVTGPTDIGSLLGAFASAREGIERGLSGLNRDAHEIARANVGAPGGIDTVPGALVDSLQQRLLVQASARVMSTTDQTLGTLLDTHA